jgi:predicted metallopeptidase
VLLKFLEIRWGIYYVSLLYPFKEVFIYPLEREKLTKKISTENGQQVVKHEITHLPPEKVDSVY